MDGARRPRPGVRAEGRSRRRIRLILASFPLVKKPARRVRQHVETVSSKPVVVPMPLVRVVSFVGQRFPLVFVVGKAVQHDHQRMATAACLLRQGQVDVEGGTIPTGDLGGADVDIPVQGTVTQAGNRGFRGRGKRRRRCAEYQQRSWHNGAPAHGSPSVRVTGSGFGFSVVRPPDLRQEREIRQSTTPQRSLATRPSRSACASRRRR